MSAKVEIVKQVKLSPKQRITLLSGANNGGRIESIDWDVRQTLTYLGLIEERLRLSSSEQLKTKLVIGQNWKAVCAAAQKGDLETTQRALRKIEEGTRELNRKCYFLTKAADEYLQKGRVVITTGKESKS